jgi:nucleotide-binding universal stress UspA family protein
MFERVLIASDFSKHSEQIVQCVGEIPGIKEVILLNVLYKSEIGRTWSPGDDIKKANAQFEKPKKDLESIGLKVKAKAVESGDSPEYKVIEKIADEEKADLVVMGARGKSLFRGFVLGSVSTNVLRYGTHNLLIMRYKTLDSGKMEKYCPMMFSKVLCPVDFSEAGMAAINLIKDIQQPISVHLLSVIGKGETEAEVDARTKDAEKKLEALKSDLLAKVKVNVTSEVISAEAGYKTYGTGGMASSKGVATPVIEGVEGIIIQKAEEIDASMIALSSAGKGMLDEATVGSVVFDVARRATRPVLIARSEKKA